MSEEEIKKVNIVDFKIEELTLEEQEAFNYFNKSSEEVTFETDIDGDKFFEALGIKKEDNYGEMQYKITTLLNLIVKQQEEIKNSVSKEKIREKINERQFELQQEYKDFKDDIRLNTLQEIYYLNEEE